MFLILHPEDLSVSFTGDKKKPRLEDFNFSVSYMWPAEVIIYKYDDQTLVLKGPEDI
jgi:hypothetical protein